MFDKENKKMANRLPKRNNSSFKPLKLKPSGVFVAFLVMIRSAAKK